MNYLQRRKNYCKVLWYRKEEDLFKVRIENKVTSIDNVKLLTVQDRSVLPMTEIEQNLDDPFEENHTFCLSLHTR